MKMETVAANRVAVPRMLARKFFFLLGARGIKEIFQSIFFIIIARQSTTTYGEFMLAFGFGSIVLIFTEFGFSQFLVPILSRKETNTGKILVQVSLIKSGLLFTGLLVLLGFCYLQNYSSQLMSIVLIISAGLGLDAFSNTFFVSLQVRGKQEQEGVIRSSASVISFLYAFIALAVGLAPVYIAFFIVLESALNLIMVLALRTKEKPLNIKLPYLKEIRQLIPGVIIFGLLQLTSVIYNKANLFFLQYYGDSKSVAQYSASWQIVDGISCIVSALLLTKVIYPVLSSLWQDDRNRSVHFAKNSIIWLMGTAAVISFLLCVENDRIIFLIYGSHYADAVSMLGILAVTVLFAFAHNLCALLMMSMGKERTLLGFAFIALALSLALSLLLIPASPLVGAGITIVATKGLMTVMTLTYCHLSLGLLSDGRLIKLMLLAVLGGSFYWISSGHVIREVAELMAVSPLLFYLWGQWKKKLD
jgi:O-antigen/teichoic acid export membrane protein